MRGVLVLLFCLLGSLHAIHLTDVTCNSHDHCMDDEFCGAIDQGVSVCLSCETCGTNAEHDPIGGSCPSKCETVDDDNILLHEQDISCFKGASSCFISFIFVVILPLFTVAVITSYRVLNPKTTILLSWDGKTVKIEDDSAWSLEDPNPEELLDGAAGVE